MVKTTEHPFSSYKQFLRWCNEWDEITAKLRGLRSADKSTARENGGKSGQNGKD